MKEKQYKEYTYNERSNIYIQLFSLGTNTNKSFDEKLELFYLISFLTFNMKQRNPDKFHNALDVLQTIYNKTFDENIGEDAHLMKLSIICDDLIYGVETIKKPEGYTNAIEICDRIKYLVSQWMPF